MEFLSVSVGQSGIQPGEERLALDFFLCTTVQIFDRHEIRLELPGSEPHAALPARGIHEPSPERDAAELRDLLTTIRELEFELAHGRVEPARRRAIRARLDAACERVGDLLLGGGRG